MKKIYLSKNDIKYLTEACVKKILNEDSFDNEEEFKTDNEPYFDRYKNHNLIMQYLTMLCKNIGGGNADYDRGIYWIEEPNDSITITFNFNPYDGQLHVADTRLLVRVDDLPNTINAFNWASKALTMFMKQPFKGE